MYRSLTPTHTKKIKIFEKQGKCKKKKKKNLTENNMKVVVMIKSNIIKTNKTDRNSGIKSKGRLLKKTSVK